MNLATLKDHCVYLNCEWQILAQLGQTTPGQCVLEDEWQHPPSGELDQSADVRPRPLHCSVFACHFLEQELEHLGTLADGWEGGRLPVDWTKVTRGFRTCFHEKDDNASTFYCNAHCVLLGPNYTMKKNCLSWAASPFDKWYATQGHNGKKSWFWIRRWRASQKTLFFAVPSLGCVTLDQCNNWGQVNWSISGH